LNPDFEDATLHQLFSSADASGDGQLQLEEFIAWIFAEDQQLSFPGAPSFGFTYVISNAPRAELNGEYVQQDQQYGHRPVFYCARTGKYLFYHAPHRQWQIYAKPSTRAIARLKTQRSPQMALGANWEVRQQTGTEATYVEASEALGENRREIVDMATPIPLIPDSSSHSSCSNLVHSSIGFHFYNSSFEEPQLATTPFWCCLSPCGTHLGSQFLGVLTQG
jgi:hypothetical protein